MRTKTLALVSLVVIINTLSVINIIGGSKSDKVNFFEENLVNCGVKYKVEPYCFKESIEKSKDELPLSEVIGIVERVEKDRKLGGKCHEVMHYVGVNYYNTISKHKNAPKLCGAGLIHGALQEAIFRKEYSKTKTLLNNNCRSIDNQLDSSCTHGIGHDMKIRGLVKEQIINDCSKAIDKSELNYGDLVFSCLEGYFMEDSYGKLFTVNQKKEYIPVSKNPILSELERDIICNENFDDKQAELIILCKVITYRFNFANDYFDNNNKSSADFNGDYIGKQCSLISDQNLLFLCNRQAGAVAFAFSELTDNFAYKSMKKFCNDKMVISCIEAYVEQLIGSGVELNYGSLARKLCLPLGEQYSSRCLIEFEKTKNKN